MKYQLSPGQISILGSVRDGDTPILWTPDLLYYQQDVQQLCAWGLLVRVDDGLVLTDLGQVVLDARFPLHADFDVRPCPTAE